MNRPVRHRRPSHRVFRLVVASVCLASLSACGGSDGPTGPSANFTPVGSWALTITNASATDISCTVTGYVVTFTESGGILGGTVSTASGVTNTCVINGQTVTGSTGGSGTLTTAARNGASISFGYSTTSGPSSFTGTINNDTRMSGAASIRLSFSGTPRTLTGTWSATRQ